MSETKPPPLVAIVGPTGVGKSDLGLRVATALDCEIVSADSRQVYRGMDVGTSKPTSAQRAQVVHHLIDIAEPDQEYSLVVFLRHARQAFSKITSRGKLPVVVGGTGQYIWGLLEDWQVPEVPPNSSLRRELEKLAEREGPEALHRMLAKRDSDAAARVDPKNVRRVIRAQEVASAEPGSGPNQASKGAVSPTTLIVGLTLPREELYRRIDVRIERMMDSGWADEVKALLDSGYSPELPSMSSLGYREFAKHLSGELTLDEAVARIKGRTHRFARQQYAWFRHDDERIQWYQATPEGFDNAERDIRERLAFEAPTRPKLLSQAP